MSSTTVSVARWAEPDPANVGLRVRLPSGATVMLLRPLQQPVGYWDCAYLDALGRVRMVADDRANTGAHAVTLSGQFLTRYGQVVPA